jgi:hypothetical protein
MWGYLSLQIATESVLLHEYKVLTVVCQCLTKYNSEGLVSCVSIVVVLYSMNQQHLDRAPSSTLPRVDDFPHLVFAVVEVGVYLDEFIVAAECTPSTDGFGVYR